MLNENIEIKGAEIVSQDIEKRLKTTGVKGLDIEQAKKLGVFQRISNLLCVAHASIVAAYRIYGGVDYLIDQLRARKNEIAKEMNLFDKSFERFSRFWSDYYANGKSWKEVSAETENLYHKIMDWMEMPESWQLGEEQRTPPKENVAIKIDMQDGRVLSFRKTSLYRENVVNNESWGVLCFNPTTNKNTTVNVNMDKSSAIMVAKRLSDQNKDCVYTVSIIRDIEEKRTDVIPYKSYMGNKTIGNLLK